MQSSLHSLLCQLGSVIRDRLYAQQKTATESLAQVAERTSADIIYEIDKISESLILDWLAKYWPENSPVQLVMEGIEDSETVTFPMGLSVSETHYTLIIDPIDGTRGLMYDKRSAWALIGLAPRKPGIPASLEDISIAVMTELPTSKQYLSEQLSATRSAEGSTHFLRVSTNLLTGETKPLPHTPSKAEDLSHGFASVAKFFPQAKAALAAFEEELFDTLTPDTDKQEALIFDDQYISTGGQLYELIAGHDRAVFDIRPLAFDKCGFSQSLTCHPYDLCTALVARAAGIVVEKPDSSKLDIPLDTTTPVSWVAYANETLANKLRPLVNTLIAKHFR